MGFFSLVLTHVLQVVFEEFRCFSISGSCDHTVITALRMGPSAWPGKVKVYFKSFVVGLILEVKST